MPDQPVELCFTWQHFYPIHGGGTLRFLRYFPELRKRGVNTRVVTATPKASKLIDADYVRDWQPESNGFSAALQQAGSVPCDRDGRDSAALMGRAAHASVAVVVSGLATVFA